jgi:hypothetical protein
VARPDDVEFKEVVNAVEISHHQRGWADLPLGAADDK